MSNLVVIAYDDLDQAKQVMNSLTELVKEHSITLEDAVIVEHQGASDYGVDDNFMKELGDKLPPGGAAVFVLVREATRDKVVPEVSKYGGHVIQSSLSNEQEAQLQQALDARGIGATA